MHVTTDVVRRLRHRLPVLIAVLVVIGSAVGAVLATTAGRPAQTSAPRASARASGPGALVPSTRPTSSASAGPVVPLLGASADANRAVPAVSATPAAGTGSSTAPPKVAPLHGLHQAALLVVAALLFSRDAGSEDRILAEVDRLRGRGVLRLLDMLFVAKSQDGTIERLTIGADEDFGALLAAVIPVTGDGPAAPAQAAGPGAFDPAGAQALADSLPPGTALAFLLVEHHWAAPLFDAIAESGGTLIGEGFLTPEAGLVVGAEVAALEEASQVIAAAQQIVEDQVIDALRLRVQPHSRIKIGRARLDDHH